MKPFFQHLKPAASLPSLKERQDLAQVSELEDLQRYRGQSVPSEVIDPLTNRKLMLFEQLPFAMADDLLPNSFTRHYPSSVLPTGIPVNQRLAQVTRSLDRDDEPGEIELHTGSAGIYDKTLTQGFIVGADKTESFSVSHLTGNRWHCTGGNVSGGGKDSNQQVVAAATLTGDQGFIGFSVGLTPKAEGAKTPFGIACSSLEIVVTYTNNGPVRTLYAPDEDKPVSWTSGSMFVPIAYVVAPLRGAVLEIIPIRGGGDFVFDSTYGGPGLPIIFTQTA